MSDSDLSPLQWLALGMAFNANRDIAKDRVLNLIEAEGFHGKASKLFDAMSAKESPGAKVVEFLKSIGVEWKDKEPPWEAILNTLEKQADERRARNIGQKIYLQSIAGGDIAGLMESWLDRQRKKEPAIIPMVEPEKKAASG